MPRFDLITPNATIATVASMTATDDATPLSIDDTSGSVGSLSITLSNSGVRPAIMKRLKGSDVSASTSKGTRALGRVAHVNGDDDSVNLTIENIATRLSVPRSAKPYIGTVAGALRYWAGLVKIPAESVVVDAAIASLPVALVGFHDLVWQRMKLFGAATGIEIVVRDNTIVARPPREVLLVIEQYRLVSASWDTDDSNMAQKVEVVYYEPKQVLAGDDTPDYSRSNLPPTEGDDPFQLNTTAAKAQNRLPPGWAGDRTIIS